MANRKYVRLANGKIPGFKLQSDTDYVGAKGGQTIFTSPLILGGVKNASLIGVEGKDDRGGIAWAGSGVMLNHGGGANVNLLIQGLDFTSTNKSMLFEGGGANITWNGGTDSALYNEFVLQHSRMNGNSTFFYGTWEPPKTGHNFIIGHRWFDVVTDISKDGNPVLFQGQSIFDMEMRECRIKSAAQADVDCGKIWIVGNIKMTNCEFAGGDGYPVRLGTLKLVGLGNNQDSTLMNIYDHDSTHYGTIDWRLDDFGNDRKNLLSNGPIKFTGGQLNMMNCTAANKKDRTNGYVTPLIVCGGQLDEQGHKAVVNLQNCLAFNAFKNPDGSDGGSSLVKDNSSGNCIINGRETCIDLPSGVAQPTYLDPQGNPANGTPARTKGIGFFNFAAGPIPVAPKDPGTGTTPPVTDPPVVKPPVISAKTIASVEVTPVTTYKTKITFSDGSVEQH